jgi:hypothetical protein
LSIASDNLPIIAIAPEASLIHDVVVADIVPRFDAADFPVVQRAISSSPGIRLLVGCRTSFHTAER